MPIYEYQCNKCQHLFEEWQTDFTEREVPCPLCSGNSKRIISNTSFVLKGSGWYVTDYSRGNSSTCASGGNGNGNGNGNGSGPKKEATTSSEGSAKPEKKSQPKKESAGKAQ